MKRIESDARRRILLGILSLGVCLIIIWGMSKIVQNRPAVLDPVLSNTYNFVAIADLAQIDLGSHKQKTIRWIEENAQADGSFTFEGTIKSMTSPEDLLDSIYYAALTLNELKQTESGRTELPYHQKSIETIQNLQMTTGAFSQIAGKGDAYWKEKGFSDDSLEIVNLTNTYRAIVTLDLLEAAPLDRDASEKWLTILWTELMQKEVLPNGKIPDDTLPHLNTILYALSLLETEIKELPEFDAFFPLFQEERQKLENIETLTGSILYDTYWIQDISQILGLQPVDLSKSFIPALIENQRKDGGFNLYFQLNSESVGTNFALELIVEAGEPIPQREKIVSLVEKYKARPGGFSLIH